MSLQFMGCGVGRAILRFAAYRPLHFESTSEANCWLPGPNKKTRRVPDADHRAFLLYQKGVASETAQKYYSFRLTEADAKKWSIVIV